MGRVTLAPADDDLEVEPMSLRRITFIGSAALLGFGLAGAPAVLAGADTPPPAGAPATTDPNAPVVTSAAGTFTVTLPGLGTLSFGVDATSGALTGITVSPVDGSGFTIGAPVTTLEGITLVFTSPTATKVLQVEVHMGANGPVVSAEVDATDPAGASNSDTESSDANQPSGDGESAQDGADGQSSEHGGGTPTTTVPTTPATGTPATTPSTDVGQVGQNIGAGGMGEDNGMSHGSSSGDSGSGSSGSAGSGNSGGSRGSGAGD
jgi:hypothetical protein